MNNPTPLTVNDVIKAIQDEATRLNEQAAKEAHGWNAIESQLAESLTRIANALQTKMDNP